MAPNTLHGSVVYRLEENIIDKENNIYLSKGDVLSHETMSKLIALDWYEIKVTIMVLR